MTGQRLDLPFVLEAPVESADGAGGVTRDWAALGTLWGGLRAGAGRERLEGGTGLATATHTITVRAAPPGAPSRPDVRYRLRRGLRVFRIVSVRESGPMGKYLDCRVIEEATV